MGLTSKGIEIHFPLSPTISLIILDPVSFCQEPSKRMTRDFRHVIRERDHQIRYSTRFLFSSSPNFDFCKTVLKEKPKFKDTTKIRIKVE